MNENKIFVGPRLRRIRLSLELTQSAMAKQLEISPSYLNLIERNQRPLTVQLLLKLSTTYNVDIAALSDSQNAVSFAELNSIFADPLLAGELPSNTELVELSDVAPNVAVGLVKLYHAHQESLARLADLSGALGASGTSQSARLQLPYEEAGTMLGQRAADWHEVEETAVGLRGQLRDEHNLYQAMVQFLRSEWGVSIQFLPVDVMPDLRRRFDRHSNRLFLSDRLVGAERMMEVATECVRRTSLPALSKLAQSYATHAAETPRLIVRELQELSVLAVLMPKKDLLRVGKRCQFSIYQLAARFDVSILQCAKRLATVCLNRDERMPPFFYLEMGSNGRVISRYGQTGFPTEDFGGECPKLAWQAARQQPGELVAQCVTCENGAEYAIACGTADALSATLSNPARRRSFLIGCAVDAAADWGHSTDTEPSVPIGARCRICARRSCANRGEAPVALPLNLDEDRSSFSRFGD